MYSKICQDNKPIFAVFSINFKKLIKQTVNKDSTLNQKGPYLTQVRYGVCNKCTTFTFKYKFLILLTLSRSNSSYHFSIRKCDICKLYATSPLEKYLWSYGGVGNQI